MESMRDKVSALDLWLNNHQMRLNEKKSKLLINKLPDRIQPLIVQGCHYYPQKRLRYLGVNLVTHDNGPDFFLDLKDVKPDLKRRCSLLYKASKWIPSRNCLLFAKSIIMGKLNFFLPFLGAENDITLDPLVKGLNEAMRVITGTFCSTPVPLIHSQSGIPPLNILIKKAAGRM